MAAIRNTLQAWDYVVFGLILVVSASIGIFYGCIKSRQKTTSEFLMANREMTALPVSLSLLASFMSAITLLGTPAEIYVYGTQYWMIWVGYCMVIPLAAHVYLPVFYRLRLTSVYEYLELRFKSKGLRVFGAVIYIVQMLLYMAIVLYAPSLALNAVSGLNVWISVFTVGIVCTFYTALGGMKAVMWTDVFQIVIMFTGLFAVLIKGSIDFNGFGNIWKYMEQGDRIEFFNWDPNPLLRHNIWSIVFGGATTWLAVYGINQAQVQRALSTATLKQAQIALWVNLPGLTALLTICSLCGMVVYAHYKDCDPLSTNRITAKDQLLPLYVMDALSFPGIPGLFTACIFSGALSTLSSGLNSLSAVTIQDLVRYLCFPDMTEARATLTSKILSIVYAGLCILLTFIAAELGGVLQAALALFGMIGGPVLGLYTLGILFPCANYKGAYAGVISSLVLTVWLGIGANVYKPYSPKAPISTQCPNQNLSYSITSSTTVLYYNDINMDLAEVGLSDPKYLPGYFWLYEISYMWYSTFAVFIVHLIGLPVSLLTGSNKGEPVDAKLLCPIFDVFCCYLPNIVRSSLRCNVEYSEDQQMDLLCCSESTKSSKQEDVFNISDPSYIHDNSVASSFGTISSAAGRTTVKNVYINPAMSTISLASNNSLQYETSI